MAISTNGTVLARLAGGLYNTQMSNATYKEVASLDPATLANTLYARDFSSSTDAAVATTLVTNLGLSSVAGLSNWVAAQLTAAGSAKGAKVVDLLNSFAQMTADTTYGAFATAFNTKVDAALALSQTADRKEGTFSNAGAPVSATFALTAGVDAITGTAADDTINATVATLGALDVVDAGAGADTLNVVDTGAVASLGGASIAGVETLKISAGGAVGAVAAAAVTTTPAVAQVATYTPLATGTFATTSKLTVTIGNAVYDNIAIGATGVVGAGTAIAKVLNDHLGDDAGDNDLVDVAFDIVTGVVTVTSKKAGTALPTISVASTVAADTITQNAVAAAVTANTVGTAPAAVKEVVQITLANTNTAGAATTLDTGDAVIVSINGSDYATAASGTTADAVATDVAAVINAALGATSAVATGAVVTVTSLTAGVPLPYFNVQSAAATGLTDAINVVVANKVANTAATTAAAVAAPTGVTTYTVSASGAANVSGAATTAMDVTGTAVQTSGGSDVKVTASNSVNVVNAKGAVTVKTGATTTTMIGAVAADTATGAAADATGVYITGGTSVAITGSASTTAVKVGTTPFAVASVNTTGGLPDLNGSVAKDPTGDVSISRITTATSSSTGLVSATFSTATAKVYANGGATVSVKGAGATDIFDVGTFALRDVNGVSTIGTSKLATVNLGGLSDTANITSDAIATVSVSDSRAAVSINVLNSGKTGANSGAINYVLSNVGTSTSARVTLNDATATAVNISSGAASTYTGTTNSGSSSFVTVGSAKATSIGMTNSLRVDLGDVLANAGKVASINGSTATGAIVLTVDSTPEQGMAVTTGSGNDVVTIKSGANLGANATSALTTTINLGAGNDSLLNGSTSVHTVTGATFNGGDGVDTISASLLNAGNVARFTGFETLGLDLTTAGAYDTTLMGSITGLSLLANSTATGAVTYSGVKAAQGLSVASTVTNTASTTALGFETAVTTGTADSYTVTFAGTGTTSSTATKTVIDAGVVSLDGIETVNLASGGTGYTNNTIALTDADATSLVITGNQYATVTFATAFGTAATASNGKGVSLVDASANTAGVNITIGSPTTVFESAYAALAIKGSSAADSITLAASDALAITVDGGAGNDTITTAVSKSSSLTGGAGADNFVVGATVYGASSFMTTIVDASALDRITLVDRGAETWTSTKVDVSAATTFAGALAIALGTQNGSTNGIIEWFQYGPNTYIVEGLTNTAGAIADAATTDLVVKLSGLVDLSTATVVGNVITLG